MSLASFLPPPPPAWRPVFAPLRIDRPLSAVTALSNASESLRQQIMAAANLVVVKVGTRVLTQPDGTLNYLRIEQLAEEIHAISHNGRRVVLVSSGAVRLPEIKTYSLSDAAAAHKVSEGRHLRGKLVFKVR